MIRPAATVAVRTQAERHLAMCQARAAWLPLCAKGVKAENAPESAAWTRAWSAWSANASDAERAAEFAATADALHTAQQRVGGG